MKIKLEQVLVILFIVSIPFIVYFSVSSKSQIITNGIVTDFGAITDDAGIHSYLMVKLEDNRSVKIDYPLASRINVGKKVIVNERTTKLLDMKKYRIVKWYRNSRDEIPGTASGKLG